MSEEVGTRALLFVVAIRLMALVGLTTGACHSADAAGERLTGRVPQVMH